MAGRFVSLLLFRPFFTRNYNPLLRKLEKNPLNAQYLAYSAASTVANNEPTMEKSPQGENLSKNSTTDTSKVEEISPKEKELLEQNAKLLEDVKVIDDKYKRALAENENIRARMRREVADAKQYGIQNFIKDLIEVADILGSATQSIPKEALDQGNSHLKNLFEGLQMTEMQLQTVFKRHGVIKVNPLGEKFNPNHHEALFELEDPNKEPGTIGTVTKVGYKLHDRIVRPALVGVIKSSQR